MTRAVLAACLLAVSLAAPARAMPADEARHLLARTEFAASPRAIEALGPLSRDRAVEKLLASARRTAVTPPPAWTAGWKPPRLRELDEEERREIRRQRQGWAMELKAWWYREMIATPSPMTEAMTLFWHNHFTSGLRKVRSPVLMYRQNATLRRHALGNFADLLRAMARDPAMLVYLDGARNRRDAPNENFARELLELFTLGEGHYGEKDIKEAARAFTGWSLDRDDGTFAYRQRWHDDGLKAFLGRSGRFDGDDIIDILLAHPRTAELVVEKAWRAFVSEAPDPAEVRRLAALFRAADYEIKPLLHALFTSDAFYGPAARGRLIKSPSDLLVGTVRQFAIPVERTRDLARIGRRMGQDLFDPPNVKGWPGGTAWITADTLLVRQAVLARITRGEGDEASMEPAAERKGGLSGALYDRWVAGLAPPWDDARAIALLLLPVEPADAPVLDREGSGALVRQLMRDPVYQLK